jgi:hypothetical protein
VDSTARFFPLHLSPHFFPASTPTEEYAYACDSFGYLRSAKQLRQAYEERKWPKFELESPQTRLLIDFMLQSKIPVDALG